MYIFSATLQAKPGRGGELGAHIPTMRDAVAEATGSAAYGWAVSSGAPIGSYGISMRVEGHEQLLDFQQKMGASENYHAEAAKLADALAAPSATSLSQIVAMAGDQGEPAPIVRLTQTTLQVGHVADAMAWGQEMLQHVHNTTGMSGLFTSVASGSPFDVMWIFSSQSGADLDATNAALQADTGYVGLIDKAANYIVPGSTARATLVQMS
ncbi:MAG: hypothetical protein HKN94_12825 [Acidimicrobiales bacterium]|nr:hypothetical protein [Acidimicrobiales bacterium]RZV44465.1 MAG: hypothetical protein EX269_11640 [Acidimicrobiales bacterium]